MTSHPRAPGKGTRFFTGFLLLFLLFAAGAGCTAHRAETVAREETPASFIDSFMGKVVANDYEGAFHDLDMETLVNYGRRPVETYEALSPSMKERFRKDFVEGVYARLFRNLPRESATHRVAAVESDPLTVEVSGSSPRKNLFFTLQRQRAGMKIVLIDKALRPGSDRPAVAGLIEVCRGDCDFDEIQEALAATAEGGTVLVHDGIYEETLDFLGKSVTVRSVNGPRHTFLRGGGDGSIVSFASGEGEDSVLDGFSITGGRGAPFPGIRSIPTRTGEDESVTFGGGIFCNRSSPTLRNLIISGNSAVKGGGLACWKASPLVENCIISGNRALANGGGVYAGNSSPRFVATTISGNLAGSSGGGIACYWSNPVVSSSIFWGNSSAGGEDSVESCGKDALIEYSTLGVGRYRPRGSSATWPGTGNIETDPLFRERRLPEEAPTVEGDYRLTAPSPCIDGAARSGLPDRDIEGEPRPYGKGADMGADEFTPTGAQ